MVITKYSLIGTVLSYYPQTAKDFEDMGLGCVRCPSSARETLEQACNVHGIDLEQMIEKLDKRVNG